MPFNVPKPRPIEQILENNTNNDTNEIYRTYKKDILSDYLYNEILTKNIEINKPAIEQLLFNYLVLGEYYAVASKKTFGEKLSNKSTHEIYKFFGIQKLSVYSKSMNNNEYNNFIEKNIKKIETFVNFINKKNDSFKVKEKNMIINQKKENYVDSKNLKKFENLNSWNENNNDIILDNFIKLDISFWDFEKKEYYSKLIIDFVDMIEIDDLYTIFELYLYFGCSISKIEEIIFELYNFKQKNNIESGWSIIWLFLRSFGIKTSRNNIFKGMFKTYEDFLFWKKDNKKTIINICDSLKNFLKE